MLVIQFIQKNTNTGILTHGKNQNRRVTYENVIPFEVGNFIYSLQSEEVNDTVVTTSQTATFTDTGVGDTVTYQEVVSTIFDADVATSIALGDFLQRPTLIHSFSWEDGAYVSNEIDPWSLFLNTAQIKYKLNNFAWLRGNLKVKVVMNSTPFYYGAMMMSYTPLHAQASTIDMDYAGALIPLSQRPHIFLLPQDDVGGEMDLPFFWPNNMVNITVAAEVALMGRLRFTEYTALRAANGAAISAVTVKVYAWMEDPVLSGPTYKLALQGKKVKAGKDEYQEGVVESTASSVALWANYFDEVPVIGPFARATSVVASTVSSVARLFGWSNPPVIDNIMPVYDTPFAGLASANISTPITKLCLDPKNELSVDPRIIGLPSDDELAISFLVQKESYLCTIPWTMANGEGTRLFNVRASPVQKRTEDNLLLNTQTVHFNTVSSYISHMFDSWRGDLIFRFRIICSKYHRGRIRLTWDPVNTVNTTDDLSHVCLTKVADISLDQDIEFRVPYMQAQTWCAVVQERNHSFVENSVPSPGIHNGVITVNVATLLSAPDDTADVNILCFVRGAENLEFNDIKGVGNSFGFFDLQSEIVGESTTSPPILDRFLINYGEPVVSLRTVLRRTSHYDTLYPFTTLTATDNLVLTNILQSRFPGSPGYDTNAYTLSLNIAAGAYVKYNYCFMTPLAFIAEMFMAHRGAIRWHYNAFGPKKVGYNVKIHRSNSPISAASSEMEGTSLAVIGTTFANISSHKNYTRLRDLSDHGQSGLALFRTAQQEGMGVETPMYTRKKFYVSNARTSLVGQAFDDSQTDTMRIQISHIPTEGSSIGAGVERYVSIGTDFNLHFFLNAPVLYTYPAPNAG